jgi:hypothetical protein
MITITMEHGIAHKWSRKEIIPSAQNAFVSNIAEGKELKWHKI